MEQSKQFRTAGFGGFHRQDVLDYIQRTAKEQSEQRETLKKELQEAEARIAALTASNTDLRTERDQARDQLARGERMLLVALAAQDLPKFQQLDLGKIFFAL